jgi:hypothetical protein
VENSAVTNCGGLGNKKSCYTFFEFENVHPYMLIHTGILTFHTCIYTYIHTYIQYIYYIHT